MDAFEEMYGRFCARIARYVYCKTPCKADGDDILQETWLAAYRYRDALLRAKCPLAWLLRVASAKCADFYRARKRDAPLRETFARGGAREREDVRAALDRLRASDRALLHMRFYRQLDPSEIAAALHLSQSAVKSRMHAAKNNFRREYAMENSAVKRMPDTLPAYRIEPMAQPPFPVVWEEMMGWFIVPRAGESLRWAIYDQPGGVKTEEFALRVTGRASVHGIEGVEIEARESNTAPAEHHNADVTRTFVAQLTDTHCRVLAECHTENGVKRLSTFLDEGDFLPNWGFGEDNCGNETHIAPKGILRRDGANIFYEDARADLLDVTGRYAVRIGGRTYDTVCVTDVELYESAALSEQFLDKNGRTVLWRRFNRDDWRLERYGATWSERFPEAETLYANGRKYVHWYDCATEYVMHP